MADVPGTGQVDDTQQPTGQETPEPSKVNYLGQELSPEELLERLHEKDAFITRQFQEKAQEPEQPPPPPQPQVPEDEVTKQTRQWLDTQGYVSKDQVQEMLKQELTQAQQMQQIDQSVKTLSGKYDGKGEYKDYPAFDPTEVLPYAQEKQIYDLEEAYQSLNREKIMDAEIKKATGKAPTPDTSDAPRDETNPHGREAVRKAATERALATPGGIGAVLEQLGQGDPFQEA